MANELQSLSDIFQSRLFRIPDYQRGYAWQQQQLVDFWEDLVNLQPDRFHYTGLLSLKPLKNNVKWDEDHWLIETGYKPYHIVDGQQRITTCVILLNEIVEFVRGLKENEGKSDRDTMLGYETIEDIVSKYICRKRPPRGMVTTYIFSYETDNPSAEFLRYRIFGEPYSGEIRETYYTKNLQCAKEFFSENIRSLYAENGSGESGLDAVSLLYRKLTQKLMFNIYEIDDDYDVFVSFETMNNRGKKLTNLELLKNRLIYLTTLYDDTVLDKKDKSALRRKINEAWSEVYYQLGKNKDISLSDDGYLRDHWIVYFGYSRNGANEYINFLLNKFSPRGIFEKTPVLSDPGAELTASDDAGDEESAENTESNAPKAAVSSRLQPKEIENYVNSLKDMAKYWYDTWFPFGSEILTPAEQKRVDRLNRIGIIYFRPLVTAVVSRQDFSVEARIKIFDAIERFIFVFFRLGGFNSSYGSGVYYRAARGVYSEQTDVDELCEAMCGTTTDNVDYVFQLFAPKMTKAMTKGNGYYDWSRLSLKYFLFEYEDSLAEKYGIDRFRSWEAFSKTEKDTVSIEHILPQTPTKFYWRDMFRQFTDEEIKTLSGALGNLLPLAQSVNSALQNDSFEEKKHSSATTGRRGYEDGSHSEIEVSKYKDWTAEEIYQRSEHLLEFMQERWHFHLKKDVLEQLIGIAFVKDGRDIPPALEKKR